MDVTEQFKNLVNSHNVEFDTESLNRFSLNDITSSCVIRPKSSNELTKWLKAANKDNAKVHFWGSGKHQHIGGIPDNFDLAIVLNQLNQLVEFNPEDLSATVQCGMTLMEFQKVLSRHRLYLPLDSPCSQQATIGGIVASNAYGPRSHRFGTVRDMVIGLKAVLADGTEIKAGGKTVKNVAGYDLCKLFIGSMGTLGVITETTFRLWPLPEKNQILLMCFNTLDEVKTAARQLIHSQLSISGLIYLNQSAGGLLDIDGIGNHSLLILLSDSKEVVADTTRVIDNIIRSGAGKITTIISADDKTIQPNILDAIFCSDTHQENQSHLILKAILPKSEVFEFMHQTEQLGRESKIEFVLCSYCGRGIVYCISNGVTKIDTSKMVEVIGKLRLNAQQIGGSLVIEKAPTEVKKRINVWDLEGKQVEWMRKIKQEFDPNGVITTGRFVGGI